MKSVVLISLLLMSSLSNADTNFCQAEATQRVKALLGVVVNAEWKWEKIEYVETDIQSDSYKVVKNPAFHQQWHENYVFKLIASPRIDDTRGVAARFEIQMFANQWQDSDPFSCYTNSFRLSELKEGVEI